MSEAVQVPEGTMSVEAFLDCAMAQPKGRFELHDGRVVAMSPQQTGAHLRTRRAVDRALDAAIAAAGLDCEAFSYGATVRVDDRLAFQPDALVNCGERMGDAALIAPTPVIVVDVVSRSSWRTDTSTKLAGYFRVPSITHYLILLSDSRTVIHHRRGEGGRLESTILGEGELSLDPPGLRLPVASLFPA